MNDPVDRLLMDRARADVGFPGGLLVSLLAHILTVGAAFAAPFIFPPPPPLRVADGFAVVMPRGGGGDPNAGGAPTPPVETPAPPESNPPAQAPPPLVLKPPKEEPRKGLPEVDARKSAKKTPEKQAPKGAGDTKGKPASAGASRGPGTASGPQGLAIGPPGPGVPGGTDSGGDWYLAGVQQKIWTIWSQQVKAGFTEPIGVTFTILADGSVADVQVTTPGNATLLNLAAQRAILSAAPFGPLPKDYATNRYTIQAIFKPTS